MEIGKPVTVECVVRVARNFERVELSLEAKKRIVESHERLKKIAEEGKAVYGINTGFGDLKGKGIARESVLQLQKNLIRSHACGVGRPFSEEVVRAAMLVRLNSLAKGFSGVRLAVVETLAAMLNDKVHPVVPEQGSVGSSGDLAPLSHLTLVMLGEGEAFFQGERMPGKMAMAKAGVDVIELEAKEGLALSNGTAFMAACGVLALHDAKVLAETADVAGAMTLEALFGSRKAFDERVQAVRPHAGQRECAKHVLALLEESEVNRSHENCGRVQDSYSLRCIPQVHGASRDALAFVEKVLEIEVNSATDNPLVFDDEVISGGNFHGQPLALALDFLGIAVAELADISERRTARLLDSRLNEGLPAFLVEDSGLNSGFMIVQYTAAALVSENKVLAHPASVDSIPTSANQEDHVSMGSIAARKALKIVENTQNVLAVELLCAAQALDFRKPLTPGKGARQAVEIVRKAVPFLSQDRELHKDIASVRKLVCEEKFVL